MSLLLLQLLSMQHLSKQLRAFANLPNYVSGNPEFLDWLDCSNPELSVPECWETDRDLCKCVCCVGVCVCVCGVGGGAGMGDRDLCKCVCVGGGMHG